MATIFPARILQDHNKPEQGQACNHCGLCCRVQACDVSKTFLNSSQAPCLALEMHDGLFMCGMLIRPAHYLGMPHADESKLKSFFGDLIGVYDGCDMSDRVIAIKLGGDV